MWWARFWKWLCSLCSCGRNPAPSTSSTIQVHEKRPTLSLSDFKRDVKAIAASQREAKQRESVTARQAEVEEAAKQREEKREKALQQKMQEQRTAAFAAQQEQIAAEKAKQKLKEDKENAAAKQQFQEMLAYMDNPKSETGISRSRSASLLVFRRRSSSASTADTQEPNQTGCCAWLSSKVKYCCACFFRKEMPQPTSPSTAQPVRTQTNTAGTYESFITLSKASSTEEEFITMDGSRISPKLLGKT